jgi:hypothetical protein
METTQERVGRAFPPIRVVQPQKAVQVVYGFVDASGAGFGSALQLDGSNTCLCYGVWGRDSEGDASNFRELKNLVLALEDGVDSGKLHQAEVFIYTDNTTAERVYYKGNFPSRKLFEPVLHLQNLEMHAGLLLHVIHVTGTRMIAQGTVGLLWDLLTEPIFGRQNEKWVAPLHQPAYLLEDAENS